MEVETRTNGATQWVQALVKRLWRSVRVTRAERKLRVCESVALGDKRLVAVIVADERRFLIGATPSGVSLLAKLDAHREQTAVLLSNREVQQWVM